MALIVQKFGGTSVGSIDRIKNVAKRVARWRAQGHEIILVPSAMAGETNRLIGLAKEISPLPDPRELDVIASTGEQVTIALLAMAMHAEGIKAKSFTGSQVGVLTDSTFTKARILKIDQERIRKALARWQRCRRRRFSGSRRGWQHHHAWPWRLGHLGSGSGRCDEGRRVPNLH